MSRYSALSIWENNPHSMNWYDHVVGRKTPADPFITPNTDVSFTAVEVVEEPSVVDGGHDLSYQDAWFSELKAHDREKEQRRRKKPQARENARAATPPRAQVVVPASDPYFEYMFAAVDQKNEAACSTPNSIDDLSFGKKSDSGNELVKPRSTHNTDTNGAVRKRHASESSDYEVAVVFEHSRFKKARLDSHKSGTCDAALKRVMSIDDDSIISSTATGRTGSDFFSHRALAVAPKGYAGQFNGMIIRPDFVADHKYNLICLDSNKSGIHLDFGDPRHPNGVFTHTSLISDPYGKSPDFTKNDLHTGHPLLTCMNYATDMTIAATHNNVVNLRSHDEEILRRESHLECAHARLEGVSVGYYRYYQGHLSVEEYHDAEMCIC